MTIDLKNYATDAFYDEMLERPNRARPHAKQMLALLRTMDDDELSARQTAADLAIKEMGITFTVYSCLLYTSPSPRDLN